MHLRTACLDETSPDKRLYIDLCDSEWRAVEVTADEWRVIKTPPARFIRNHGMKALPDPAESDIDLLFKHLNVKESERCLVLAWLVAAMRPTDPYTVLILQGEQGTAKSTATRVLRTLVDPSRAELRCAPRNQQDLMTQALNNWCIALDNLSAIPTWLSNALCGIATGTAHGTREFYTLTEESLIDVMRPIILNGIDDLATNQDMIDRCIIINLEPIPPKKRKPQSEFWCEFNADKPAILGALLDRVSLALRQEPHIKRADLPRMADFARWGMAAFPPNEQEQFLTTYDQNCKSAVVSGLDGSSVAIELREMVTPATPFEGTMTELLKALNARASDRTRNQQAWPKLPQQLSSQLRRLATALRSTGLEIEYLPGHKHGRKVCIKASPASPESSREENQAVNGDARGDANLKGDARGDAEGDAWDAGDSELSHCSKNKRDAGDAGDAELHNLYKPNGDRPPGQPGTTSNGNLPRPDEPTLFGPEDNG